ncbi:MAG TPA: hypothetical protein PK624_10170 [Spirochaetota bacterium]|nr:hypothetical protein [Spirochaetota bacterium]HOR45146.1 hypothetical protein [Spirochaetota bacterium]HPK56738.1 hypothetical protein [Spirochaetota bacterium]
MKAKRILMIIILFSHVMVFPSNSHHDAELFLSKDKLVKLDRIPDEILSKIQEDIYIENLGKKGIKLSTEDILSTREERYVYIYKKNDVLKKTVNDKIVREIEYYESGNIKRYSIEHIIRITNKKKSFEDKVKIYSLCYIDDIKHQIEKRFFSIDMRGSQSYYVEEYEDGKIINTEFYSNNMTVKNLFKDGKIEKVNISGFNMENPINSFMDK